MKPRFYHYMGAHMVAIVCQTSGVLLVAFVSISCAGLFTEPTDTISMLKGLLAIAAAYPLGALLGIFCLGHSVFCSLQGSLARHSKLETR
jgi:hypothetical protein